jgi:Raf kinase inhibitor-like YbhB/YbcL family protein
MSNRAGGPRSPKSGDPDFISIETMGKGRTRFAHRYVALAGIVWMSTTLFSVRSDLWAQQKAKFEIKSAAFQNNSSIPSRHTCDGANLSPALSWTDPPQGTQSYALIMDDPDAPRGTFVHWVLYNLPASARQLPEGVPKDDDVQGGLQGVNDFPQTGYGGPCPPPGKPHRYFFELYALDTKLDLPAGAQKKDVEQAMKGHVLAEAQWMGRYKR